MTKRPKTWREKLNALKKPVRKPVPSDMAGMKKGEIMLIPTPQIIQEFVKAIPQGTALTTLEMRKTLAQNHDAEVTCPITTGIYLRIVTEAAFEDHDEGLPLEASTPVWRVLDEKVPLLKKLSAKQRGAIAQMRATEKLKK